MRDDWSDLDRGETVGGVLRTFGGLLLIGVVMVLGWVALALMWHL